MLDLRRLRLLHEFRLRGTIGAVGQALSYSPSRVSQQLRILEQESGTTLFVRVGRRLHLTAKGQLLALHAKRLLDLQDEVLEDLASSSSELVGSVRLAVMQSAMLTLVPDALVPLASRHPYLRIEVVQTSPEIGLFELAGHRFDLVVAEQYPGMRRGWQADVTTTDLGHDPMWVVTPRSSAATSLAALAQETWVAEPRGTAAREWLVQQCRAAGFEPDVRYEVDDLTGHVRLIERGLACGVLPGLLLGSVSQDHLRTFAPPGRPERTVLCAVRAASAASVSLRVCVEALGDALMARIGTPTQP